MARRIVTVFGASGFIGRHVVQRLADLGWTVRAAVRDPIAAAFLKPMGEIGQVTPIRADITDEAAVRTVVAGADAVINLVGIMVSRGKRTFTAIHRDGAERVAKAAAEAHVPVLIHLSALGADAGSSSAYYRSKAEGETAVQAAFPKAIIVRPSAVFGPDDNFFNRFGLMSTLLPVLPVFIRDGFRLVRGDNGLPQLDLFGSGRTALQPVYVADVANAVAELLEHPNVSTRVYELGGPATYSMKELMELVNRETTRSRCIVPLPFWYGKLWAMVLQFLPNPLLTLDQLRMLATDNVVKGGKPGLSELGVAPTSLDVVLPLYMRRYHEQF